MATEEGDTTDHHQPGEQSEGHRQTHCTGVVAEAATDVGVLDPLNLDPPKSQL